jgi:hypothetical protein
VNATFKNPETLTDELVRYIEKLNTTPLSKVDNHIGETVEESKVGTGAREAAKKCVSGIFEKLKDKPKGTVNRDILIDAFETYFLAGVSWERDRLQTYRTQHPDPAMVDRDYRDTLNEMLIEGYKKQLAQDKEVMVDRILEYVSGNSKLKHHSLHGDSIDTDHIKSMRDDILKLYYGK